MCFKETSRTEGMQYLNALVILDFSSYKAVCVIYQCK